MRDGVVTFGIPGHMTVRASVDRKRLVERVHAVIPHPVLGRFGAGSVLLKPAPDGTGIIAGGAVRAVVESAGINNVLTKSLGSANPHNVVRASFAALGLLKDPAMVARLRGKELEELMGAPQRSTTSGN